MLVPAPLGGEGAQILHGDAFALEQADKILGLRGALFSVGGRLRGQAVFRLGQGWEGDVGFGLVPVGDRGEVVAAVVGVAVLDGDLDRLGKGDGVADVVAVDVPQGVLGVAPVDEGASDEEVAEGLAVAPRAAEVVFGTGAVKRRRRLAVDVDHVVAFAPPAIGAVVYREIAADIVAAALGLEEDVVLAGRAGVLLAVLGVEPARVFGQPLILLVVHVVIESAAGDGAVVGDGHEGAVGERHAPEAVEGVARADLDRQAVVLVVAGMPEAEEIANRALDRGTLLAIPIHAEHEVAQVVGVLRGDSDPDVGDGARAFDLGHLAGLARLDGPVLAAVGIAARGVVARLTRRGEALEPRQARQQPAVGVALGCGRGVKADQERHTGE